MTDSDPDSTTNITSASGGANLNAERDIIVGGDVVGRDKIISNTTILTSDQHSDVHGLTNPYLGV